MHYPIAADSGHEKKAAIAVAHTLICVAVRRGQADRQGLLSCSLLSS